MGLYDREYTQDNYHGSYGGGGRSLRSLFPKPPGVVAKILIINTVVLLVMSLSRNISDLAYSAFSVFPADAITAIQLWRLITYQFMHADFGHLFWNMLWVYFLGSLLEKQWGGSRFLRFYLICGMAGGIVYTVLALGGVMQAGPLVGASGAIFGIVVAVTILYPNLKVYVWGIFPVPMILLAAFCILMSIFGLKGSNAGGEICHLGGAAMGAVYIFSESWRTKFKLRFKASRWKKQRTAERRMKSEVDRILKKVHEQGLHSLNSAEKRTLKRASQMEQQRGGG